MINVLRSFVPYTLLATLLAAEGIASENLSSAPSESGSLIADCAPFCCPDSSPPECIPYCDPCCCPYTDSELLYLKHIEAEGIGYEKGYSTFGAFLTPYSCFCSFLPFADLRAHVFNDGKFASNVGIGLRYLTDCPDILGAAVYYDYRHSKKHHFNQIGVSLEYLMSRFEFRLNGYFPIGDRKKVISTRVLGPFAFDRFSGHHLLISQPIKKRYEFDMAGFDAEVGAYLCKPVKDYTLYVGIGPYYYHGSFGKHTWGVKGRAEARINRYFSVEISDSYDKIFHNNFQGQVTLKLPFGCKIRNKSGACYQSYCAEALEMESRIVLPMHRQEIIVLDRHTKHQLNTEVAIDPTTNRPFNFIFVDNESHSDGTFESPFNNLLEAQNTSSPHDIIYVFTGDGTFKGMDHGITLKDFQRLFGSGIDHLLLTTEGLIDIPPLSTGMPLITNITPGLAVIDCANNNEISGIHVLTNSVGTGIQCTSIANVFIDRNTIDVPGSSIPPKADGVVFEGCSGTNQITNTIFNQPGISSGLVLLSTAPGAKYLIENNNFNATVGGGAQGIGFGTVLPSLSFIGDFDTITIANNKFTGHGSLVPPPQPGVAIGGVGFNGTGHLIIDSNTFSKVTNSTNTGGDVIVLVHTNANLTADITNNKWENTVNAANPFKSSLFVANDPINFGIPPWRICLTLTGNQSDSTTSYVLANFPPPGGIFIADIENNVGTVLVPILPITPGTCH